MDPSVLQLESGEHLVGWLGDSVSAQDIINRIPGIESIHAWDPVLQAFIEPDDLTAGRGHLVRIRDGEEVTWDRPLTPVKSRIRLHRGRNLVTWLGPDDWPIDHVALGIGRALVKAEWDGGEYVPSDAALSEPLPRLKRGTALWIEVSRTVNWLQPAGVMPTIVFAGETSEEIKQTVRRDSVDVMNHFADEYGVQPDGSILTVYIPADPDSLFDALDLDGWNVTDESVRRIWYKAGGWANAEGYVVVKTELWGPDEWHNEHGTYGEYTLGRYVMAHEYYHSIQQQTSSTDAAQWLVEGGAEWAEANLRRLDAHSSFHEELARQRVEMLNGEAPPLDHTVRSMDENWHYTIGALAYHQLALSSGEESLLDFWRAHLPEPLGPLGRWETRQPWQHAFHDVFGFTVESFYKEFSEWRAALAPASIHGRVIGPDESVLPYVKVLGRAERLEGNYDYFTTYTDALGQFELSVPDGIAANVGVDLGGCEVYYASGGLAYEWDAAEHVRPGSSRRTAVTIALQEDTCVWRISGRLSTASGGLVDVNWVYARSTGIRAHSAPNARTGDFTISVPSNGSFELSVWLDEAQCWAYYQLGGATGARDKAARVLVDGSDVQGLRFVLSDSLCSTAISGQLLDAEGVAVPDVRMELRYENHAWAGSDETDQDGRFTITVPEPGRFVLNSNLEGCRVYYRRGSPTTNRDRAAVIRIEESNQAGLRLKLREGQCSRRISGLLTDASGDPLANADVWALDDDTTSSSETDADGSFVLTLPAAGSYVVNVRIDGCTIIYRQGGATGNWRQATRIRVSEADVTGIDFRLRDGMCQHRISGKLLNADGTPHANRWVSGNGNQGSGGAHSGPDGSFSFLVTANGTYKLRANFFNCPIYLGNGGPTEHWNSAKQFRVANADVAGVEFQLPADPQTLCD